MKKIGIAILILAGFIVRGPRQADAAAFRTVPGQLVVTKGDLVPVDVWLEPDQAGNKAIGAYFKLKWEPAVFQIRNVENNKLNADKQVYDQEIANSVSQQTGSLEFGLAAKQTEPAGNKPFIKLIFLAAKDGNISLAFTNIKIFYRDNMIMAPDRIINLQVTAAPNPVSDWIIASSLAGANALESVGMEQAAETVAAAGQQIAATAPATEKPETGAGVKPAQQKPPQPTTAIVRLLPNRKDVGAGDKFEMSLMLREFPFKEEVGEVRAEIVYNPAVFRITESESSSALKTIPGMLFENVTVNDIDPTAGRIRFTGMVKPGNTAPIWICRFEVEVLKDVPSETILIDKVKIGARAMGSPELAVFNAFLGKSPAAPEESIPVAVGDRGAIVSPEMSSLTQVTTEQEAQIVISLSPPTGPKDVVIGVNKLIRIDVKVLKFPEGESLGAAAVKIKFKPDVLRVVNEAGRPVAKIEPNKDFPIDLVNIVDNAAGAMEVHVATLQNVYPPAVLFSINLLTLKEDSSYALTVEDAKVASLMKVDKVYVAPSAITVSNQKTPTHSFVRWFPSETTRGAELSIKGSKTLKIESYRKSGGGLAASGNRAGVTQTTHLELSGGIQGGYGVSGHLIEREQGDQDLLIQLDKTRRATAQFGNIEFNFRGGDFTTLQSKKGAGMSLDYNLGRLGLKAILVEAQSTRKPYQMSGKNIKGPYDLPSDLISSSVQITIDGDLLTEDKYKLGEGGKLYFNDIIKSDQQIYISYEQESGIFSVGTLTALRAEWKSRKSNKYSVGASYIVAAAKRSLEDTKLFITDAGLKLGSMTGVNPIALNQVQLSKGFIYANADIEVLCNQVRLPSESFGFATERDRYLGIITFASDSPPVIGVCQTVDVSYTYYNSKLIDFHDEERLIWSDEYPYLNLGYDTYKGSETIKRNGAVLIEGDDEDYILVEDGYLLYAQFVNNSVIPGDEILYSYYSKPVEQPLSTQYDRTVEGVDFSYNFKNWTLRGETARSTTDLSSITLSEVQTIDNLDSCPYLRCPLAQKPVVEEPILYLTLINYDGSTSSVTSGNFRIDYIGAAITLDRNFSLYNAFGGNIQYLPAVAVANIEVDINTCNPVADAQFPQVCDLPHRHIDTAAAFVMRRNGNILVPGVDYAVAAETGEVYLDYNAGDGLTANYSYTPANIDVMLIYSYSPTTVGGGIVEADAYQLYLSGSIGKKITVTSAYLNRDPFFYSIGDIQQGKNPVRATEIISLRNTIRQTISSRMSLLLTSNFSTDRNIQYKVDTNRSLNSLELSYDSKMFKDVKITYKTTENETYNSASDSTINEINTFKVLNFKYHHRQKSNSIFGLYWEDQDRNTGSSTYNRKLTWEYRLSSAMKSTISYTKAPTNENPHFTFAYSPPSGRRITVNLDRQNLTNQRIDLFTIEYTQPRLLKTKGFRIYYSRQDSPITTSTGSTARTEITNVSFVIDLIPSFNILPTWQANTSLSNDGTRTDSEILNWRVAYVPKNNRNFSLAWSHRKSDISTVKVGSAENKPASVEVTDDYTLNYNPFKSLTSTLGYSTSVNGWNTNSSLTYTYSQDLNTSLQLTYNLNKPGLPEVTRTYTAKFSLNFKLVDNNNLSVGYNLTDYVSGKSPTSNYREVTLFTELLAKF